MGLAKTVFWAGLVLRVLLLLLERAGRDSRVEAPRCVNLRLTSKGWDVGRKDVGRLPNGDSAEHLRRWLADCRRDLAAAAQQKDQL